MYIYPLVLNISCSGTTVSNESTDCRMNIDWSTHQRHAPGSDNFQLTWADDGHQYGIWGDGGGFAGTN